MSSKDHEKELSKNVKHIEMELDGMNPAEAVDTPRVDFRVIITGDRRWRSCRPIARQVVQRLKTRYGDRLVIVLADRETGVHREISEACELQRVRQDVLSSQFVGPSSQDDLKRSRPSHEPRNAEIVSRGADLCVAIHRNFERSRGTRDCVARAMERGIACWLIATEAMDLKRIHAI